jgi:predicted amidohydrolase YtcJ
VRVYVAFPMANWKPIDKLTYESYGDRWVRWGLLKGFLDGSLGSHTAAFDQPYTDAPNDSGLLVTWPQEMYDRILVLDANGLFSAVHAIGDRANRIMLDVFEKVTVTRTARDHRFRIEHAQHIRPEDIPRFAKLNVIASMQPYHAIDDGRWAERLIGPERAKTSYAFRSLLDAGVTLAFGSDWFVAPPSVLEGIYAAVTRRTLDGKHPGGWQPHQKIKVEEALRAYTYGGAYAAVEESYKGVLANGKLADLVMLDQDITRIAPEKIREAKVLLTVVGGKVAYRRP